MNKLPALPLDLDNSPARMSIHIKAGELVTVMHQWGHAVYAAGQQASTEDVVAWQNRHAPDHIVEGKYAPDASNKWVPLGYVLTRQAAHEAPTAATDQPSAEQVDERARFDACAIAAGFDVSRDTYGEYHSVDLRRYWSGWQWHASLTPTAPQAASQQAGATFENPGHKDCYCGGWTDHTGDFHNLGCPEPASQAATSASQHAEQKCTCVYATSENTDSVRKGFEMGGYLKHECEACKAAPQAATSASDPDIYDAVRDYRDRHPDVVVDAPLSNAEFLAKRLARVAKLAGVRMPSGTYEQIAEVAGTILGEIARALSCKNEDVLRFAIEVEKELCVALGREWSASGISIESLIEELAARARGTDALTPSKGDTNAR